MRREPTFRMAVKRPVPKGPTRLYTTYRAASPLATHFRKATCQEVKCKAYTEGWSYIKADLEKQNLLYAVTHAGKRYREMTVPVIIKNPDTEEYEIGPEMLCLVFEPGQVCFQAPTHRVPLGRPEFFFAGRGDFRSFRQQEARRFTRVDDWVDSFQNDQDKINTLIQKG